MRYIIALLLIPLVVSAQEIAISVASGDQYSPQVATDGTDFMVVWEDARTGTGNPNIYIRLVTASGTTPAYETPICPAPGYQRLPSIGFASTYYLAAWSDQRTGGYQIYGNYVQSDGTMHMGNFPIGDAGGSIQNVEVCGKPSGYLVIWEQRVTGISHLKATLVGEDMSSITPVDLSPTSGNQKAPSAVWADSLWWVVFQDSTASGKGIYVVSVTPGASSLTVGAHTIVTSVTHEESDPAIARGSDNRFLVAYERQGSTSGRDIFGIFLNNNGEPSGSPFPITTESSDQVKPDIAFDGVGYLVGWQDNRVISGDIYAQRVSTGGTLVSSEIVVCDSSGAQQKLNMISNGAHNMLVWQDSRVTMPDIYGARIEQMPEPSAPEATVLQPTPLVITSCNRYPVKLLITDPDGVDAFSIMFFAREDTFSGYSSSIVMVGDTMRFTPPFDWPSGDTIDLCLLDVADSLGNHIDDPLCWQFFADLDVPVLSNEIPRDDQVIDSFPAVISINALDSISGIDTSTILFIFDGDSFSYGDPELDWDGFTVRLLPPAYLDTTGTHTARIKIGDRPDVCEPNIADYSWDFFVNPGEGPNASAAEPQDGDIVADASPDVIIRLIDDDGIDTTTISMLIESVGYTWPTSMTFAETLLTVSPAETYSHAQEVNIQLLHAEDILGNDIDSPLSYSFTIDIEPPIISGLFPAPMGTLDVGIDDIWVLADDTPAGIVVDIAHVSFEFYDLSMDLLETASGGLTARGDTVVLQSGAFGSHLGDSVGIIICAELSDDVDLYGPNTSDTCWQVYVRQMGISERELPRASVISVRPNPFNTACCIDVGVTKHVVSNIEIYDLNGKLVRVLAAGESHSIVWYGLNDKRQKLPSGIYFVRLGKENILHKIILMR